MRSAFSLPFVLATLLLTGPGAAQAQSLGVSLGVHAPGAAQGAATLGLEYRAAPTPLHGGMTGGWLVAARINDLGDGWAGVGYGVQYPLNNDWHVEASFAAGLYHGGATDLGHPVEFRTQVGVGVRLDQRTHLVLVAEHLSNGGLGAINPGTDTISLLMRRVF